MSRRIVTKTEIKNKELALMAAKEAGWDVQQDGDNTISFTSGPLRSARLDLRTGDIVSDSDFGHTERKLGVFKQFYGVALVKQKALMEGVTIESQRTEGDTIVLTCSKVFHG